jgi:hypothetical protein
MERERGKWRDILGGGKHREREREKEGDNGTYN